MDNEETTTSIRIPNDLYLAIQQRASVNSRSRNSEMIRLLRFGLVHTDGDQGAMDRAQEIVREANQ